MSERFAPLAEIVAATVLLDAIDTSSRLTELGVPHALIGGLAVGLHGHPRATKDVDYLVGTEAFERTFPILVYREELKDLVKMGVIDLLGVPPTYPTLADYLIVPEEGEVPVLPVEALVLMKLVAARTQDMADISALLEVGANPDEILRFLHLNGPSLVTKFEALLSES